MDTWGSGDVVLGEATYFMVLGIDVAVRTAGIGCNAVSLMEHMVPPGAGLPAHAMEVDAVLVGLGGSLTVVVGARPISLGDSASVRVPAGTHFCYRNDSHDEARLMILTFGASEEAFLSDVARDPRKMTRSAQRHHVQLASPPLLPQEVTSRTPG